MTRKGIAPLIILLIAVAGLAAGTAGYVLYRNHAKQLSLQVGSVASSTSDFEVVYTKDGFVPDTLAVPLGARVAFRNASDIPLWTASNPHPTHTDYPEFDAKRDYAPGETYIFRFERTGTFGYHNHERSIDRGFVYVSDPANPVPNIDKTKAADQAVRDKILAMFDPHDPNSIFKVVDAVQADPILSLNCHDVAHDLGHKAYELYGFSEAMTFSNPNHLKHPLVEYICSGGYMHGIVEELSLHQPDFKTEPDPICAAIPAADQPSCYHGVGHAMMFIEDRNVTSALADCRNIKEAKNVYRCFEGVWMELFWGSTDHSGPNTLGWDPEKPLAPCIGRAWDEKPTCFLYSSFGYLRTHVKDYPGAVRMCTENGLNDSDAGFCLKGLGITMMSKFKGQHLEGSEIYVDGLATNYKHAFYEGVMEYASLSGFTQEMLMNSCDLLKKDTAVCLAALKDD